MVAFISKCELPFNFDILALHWKNKPQNNHRAKTIFHTFIFQMLEMYSIYASEMSE